MIRFLKHWFRLHRPKRDYRWDMVGSPLTDGWYVYRCPKCREAWHEDGEEIPYDLSLAGLRT